MPGRLWPRRRAREWDGFRLIELDLLLQGCFCQIAASLIKGPTRAGPIGMKGRGRAYSLKRGLEVLEGAIILQSGRVSSFSEVDDEPSSMPQSGTVAPC